MAGIQIKREEAFNYNLGKILKTLNPDLRKTIFIEETQILVDPKKCVDILITGKSIPPIAIETSYLKNDADKDAKSRLGEKYQNKMGKIKTAIAIELDEKYRTINKITSDHKFKYALHQIIGKNECRRFPKTGFMIGNYNDISRLLISTAIPKEEMTIIAKNVADYIKASANIMHDSISDKELENILSELYQRSKLTGLNTTSLLWLNAFIVQQMLYDDALKIPNASNTPRECSKAWKTIRDINWRSIFEPAITVLDNLRERHTAVISDALENLIEAVEIIKKSKLGSEINIGAELFPILSEDRKDSAAFYTQPQTAEFLAGMVITEDMRNDWNNPEIFKDFKICDLTCGTGTLLRFGYRQVKIFYCQSKGDLKKLNILHKVAMESGLYGVDVSPIASHLTSTSLAIGSKDPYGETNIGWVGVGNSDQTGSIEYIDKGGVADLLSVTYGTSSGTKNTKNYNTSITIKNNSMDVCLMNPPYSRSKKGQGVFDIAGLSDNERTACQKKWEKLIKNEPCTKRAGMAATFLCIAYKKTKPGGKIGFVLPNSLAMVKTWQQTRNMIETNFKDITAIVVASGGARGNTAFSADTTIEEMMLIATKKEKPDGKRSNIRCVTLFEPISRIGEAFEIAKAVLHGYKDGPILIGDQIGISRMFKTDKGIPWSSLGVVHDGVDRIMNGMLTGNIITVDDKKLTEIKMTTIGELFNVGPSHDSLGHLPGSKSPRGAFVFNKVIDKNDAIGKDGSMWHVRSKIQTSINIYPTHRGVERKDKTQCDKMRKTTSNLFLTRHMLWTAQSIISGFTDNHVLGGRGYVSLSHENIKVKKAFALWANSTFGMMTYWAIGDRTQKQRTTMQVRAIHKLPCPDFESFDEKTLLYAEKEFDKMYKKTLLQANQSNKDKNRNIINLIASKILNMEGYDVKGLTDLWCQEPSIGASDTTKKYNKKE